jgi:hypothetical protein
MRESSRGKLTDFIPAANSELRRSYALDRSNAGIPTYIWEQGRWFWLALHANVLPEGALGLLSTHSGRSMVRRLSACKNGSKVFVLLTLPRVVEFD